MTDKTDKTDKTEWQRGDMARISEKTGYSIQYIHKVFTGVINPSPKRAKVIAGSVDYLSRADLLFPEESSNPLVERMAPNEELLS